MVLLPMLAPLIAVALIACPLTLAWAVQEVISGTASYRERIALSPDAVFEAILEEVSRADAPAVEIARTRIESPGQPPIAFSIAYDPAAIDERLTYAVRARVLVGERLMFTSDSVHRVLTRGGPREIAVMMRMVGERSEAQGETCERNRADASLTNTYWRIVKLGDEEVRAEDGHREPHMLLRTNEARFSATVGCNQLIGRYEAAGETLRFSQVASTLMACLPPMDRRERRLVEALANTRAWHITGQVLELRDGEGRSVALFQAVYLP